MSRKLYKITTTLEEHPDFTARLKKRTNEIYSFFSFNQGDVEKMKKTKIDFEAGAGYTVKNSDFFRIGIPFTLAAVVPAYIYIWLLYGI